MTNDVTIPLRGELSRPFLPNDRNGWKTDALQAGLGRFTNRCPFAL
jgi:hypothetical protein